MGTGDQGIGGAGGIGGAVRSQVGTQVKVQIFDNEANGCGFVSFDHVYMGATRKK